MMPAFRIGRVCCSPSACGFHSGHQPAADRPTNGTRSRGNVVASVAVIVAGMCLSAWIAKMCIGRSRRAPCWL